MEFATIVKFTILSILITFFASASMMDCLDTADSVDLRKVKGIPYQTYLACLFHKSQIQDKYLCRHAAFDYFIALKADGMDPLIFEMIYEPTYIVKNLDDWLKGHVFVYVNGHFVDPVRFKVFHGIPDCFYLHNIYYEASQIPESYKEL